MNKTQVFTGLGLILGLVLAGLAYLVLTVQLGPYGKVSVTPPVDSLEEASAPVTWQLPGQNFLDDQASRKMLEQLHEFGLPARAQVTKVDQAGVWTSILLGPLPSTKKLEQAKQRYRSNLLLLSPEKNSSATTPSESVWPQILVEITDTVADEDVFELLAGPDKAKVYAFVRTAEIVEGPNGLQALNRIYLGPFATDNEALAAMGRLRSWPPANDYTIKTLQPTQL